MDCKLINIEKFYDERGFFLQTYTPSLGLTETYYQDCVSFSKKNVFRGIHFQVLKPMAKLVTVLSGKIIDYAIDLRVNSSTYLQVKAFQLEESKPQSLYIPKGFGHAFLCLEDSLVSYKCSDAYYKSLDRTLSVYDDLVNLELPLSKENVIMSKKDLNGMSISDYQKDFIFTLENTR